MNIPGMPRISSKNWDPGQIADLRSIWDDLTRAIGVNVANANQVIQDTHAHRIANFPAPNSPLGTLFWETDRNVLYLNENISSTNTWVYILGTYRGTHASRPTVADVGGNAGIGFLYYETDRTTTYRSGGAAWLIEPELSYPMSGTINSPDQKPNDLGGGDIEFLFYSTDFDRLYRWTGAAWADAAGQPQRDVVHMCRTAPAGAGWHLCDGTAAINISTATGGVSAITVPAMNAATFPRGNAAYSGPTATVAHAPTTSAHHHSIPDQNTSDVSAGTPAGTNSNPDTGNDTDAGFKAAADAAGTLVALNPHLHHTTAPVFTGSALATHHHDVPSQNTADTTVTVNTDGLPQLMDFLFYIRL